MTDPELPEDCEVGDADGAPEPVIATDDEGGQLEVDGMGPGPDQEAADG
jgi:hypothetical protein